MFHTIFFEAMILFFPLECPRQLPRRGRNAIRIFVIVTLIGFSSSLLSLTQKLTVSTLIGRSACIWLRWVKGSVASGELPGHLDAVCPFGSDEPKPFKLEYLRACWLDALLLSVNPLIPFSFPLMTRQGLY